MLQFIQSNLGTIVVGIGVLAILGLIIGKLVKNKKNGKSSCGCSCSDCPSSKICHK